MIGHRVDPTIAAIFDAYWYSRHAPKLAEGEDPLRHYLSSDPAEQSDPHPLFHGRWYLRNNPDVAASGLNPLAHYVNYGAKEGRAPCAYFDGAWYSATYLGASPRTNPLLHFIQHGAQAGHQPNPHFNTKWYVEHHPEAGAADTDPLSHYIYHGERRGFWPSPEFDPAWYISYYPDSALWPQGPFSHYLLFGQAEGRAGHRATDHDTETVAHSPDHAEPPATLLDLFDAAWYRRQVPDLSLQSDPLEHYLSEGAKRGLDPHPLFHTQWYLSRYPDVAESGQNALEHYVLYGASELRDPSEYFDVQQYCTEYAALIPAGANPLVHFLRHGARAGLNPNPYFDTRWYLSRYQRVTQSAFNPLVHYLIEGERLGYLPSPEFDPVRYAQTHADTLNWRYGALSHYLIFGRYEGRMLSPPEPASPVQPAASPVVNDVPDIVVDEPLEDMRARLPEVEPQQNPTPEPSSDPARSTSTPATSGHMPNVLPAGPVLSHDPGNPLGTLAELFDVNWYLAHTDDPAARRNPLGHYLLAGTAQGLNPHPLFHTAWYLATYPDVAASGINPFAHYVANGARELRNPCRLFDAKWYAERYPDVPADHGNALKHYCTHGAREGRDPHPLFNTRWYLDTYPEALEYGFDPLSHFLHHGESAGYAPGPTFNPEWYKLRHPDLVHWPDSLLAHYLAFGMAEGRTAAPGPLDFQSETELRNAIAAAAPSRESLQATIRLPVTGLRSLRDAAGDAYPIVLQDRAQQAEGVTRIKSFPGLAYVAKLDHAVLLAGTRYMIARDHIIHDEVAAYQDEPAAALKYYRAAFWNNRKEVFFDFALRPNQEIATGINLMHEYSNNYFHFVAETLPRLVLADEAGLPDDLPFLVERQLHENMLKLLEYANTSTRPVLFLESGTMYPVRTVYQPSDVTSVVDAYNGGPIARQSFLDVGRIRTAIDRCKARFPIKAPGRKRKIYAGRSGKIRKLTNQVELEYELARRGFEILRTDEFSLETQIQIFRDAEIIIAPTGAQITNIVWADPGTRLIVLASDHPSHQLYLWELLGRVSQAQVEFVIGPRAYVRDDRYSVHDDYSVNVQDVLTRLEDTQDIPTQLDASA